MPGSTQPCPKSAACWSPATPAIGIGPPNLATRRTHLGQDRGRHVEQPAELGVPAPGVDVVEQSPRRVGRVGRVNGAARELPDEPGIDGPERQLAAGGALGGARDVLEEPAELRAGEVRVEDESRLATDDVFHAARPELVAEGRRAPVLPHDRPVDRATGPPVPEDGRLALVRDAERGDVAPTDTRAPTRLTQHAERDPPDLLRVMLDPARPRVVLREL